MKVYIRLKNVHEFYKFRMEAMHSESGNKDQLLIIKYLH